MFNQQPCIQQPQPAPIGSLLNNNNNQYRGFIGYQQPGYNNGYYYNNYNQYQYMIQEQQRQEKIAKEQSDLMQMLTRSCLDSAYPDMPEEEKQKIVDQYKIKPPDQQEPQNTHANFYALLNAYNASINMPPPIHPLYQTMARNINALQQYHRSHIPDDADLFDFCQNSGYLTQELTRLDFMERTKNGNNAINSLYNTTQYNQLIDMHSKNTNYFFNALNAAKTVDDNTISLPDHLKTESVVRRQKFLDAILKPDGVIAK